MKLTDRLGNELKKGDVVTFSEDQIVGVIAELDGGEIARPLALDGGKITAEQRPPMCGVVVQFQTAFATKTGVFDRIIKVHKPSTQVDDGIIR